MHAFWKGTLPTALPPVGRAGDSPGWPGSPLRYLMLFEVFNHFFLPLFGNELLRTTLKFSFLWIPRCPWCNLLTGFGIIKSFLGINIILPVSKFKNSFPVERGKGDSSFSAVSSVTAPAVGWRILPGVRAVGPCAFTSAWDFVQPAICHQRC